MSSSPSTEPHPCFFGLNNSTVISSYNGLLTMAICEICKLTKIRGDKTVCTYCTKKEVSLKYTCVLCLHRTKNADQICSRHSQSEKTLIKMGDKPKNLDKYQLKRNVATELVKRLTAVLEENLDDPTTDPEEIKARQHLAELRAKYNNKIETTVLDSVQSIKEALPDDDGQSSTYQVWKGKAKATGPDPGDNTDTTSEASVSLDDCWPVRKWEVNDL